MGENAVKVFRHFIIHSPSSFILGKILNPFREKKCVNIPVSSFGQLVVHPPSRIVLRPKDKTFALTSTRLSVGTCKKKHPYLGIRSAPPTLAVYRVAHSLPL